MTATQMGPQDVKLIAQDLFQGIYANSVHRLPPWYAQKYAATQSLQSQKLVTMEI